MEHSFAYFLLFGLPTWALVDGTWAALSQLADNLPEGYDISAYLILCLTAGNLFPLIIGYFLHDVTISTLSILIKCILVTGFITGILMSNLWEYTVRIGQDEYSVPLYILFFMVGACSSTSNVTHYTFVSTYVASNTTALGTGMGIGSMIAGLLGILRGLVLINYGFTVSYYYLILALLYLPAYYSFHQLYTASTAPSSSPLNEETLEQIDMETMLTSTTHTLSSSTSPSPFHTCTFLYTYRHILSLQLINASLGYGMVPAVISYACGKFTNANLILLLATALSAIIDPWCKSMTYYVRWEALLSLQIATAVLCMLTLGLFLCASQAASSAFYASSTTGTLPILLYVTFNALFGFTTISIFRYFKEHTVEKEHIVHAYRWNGLAAQAGAFLGSIFAFALVISNSLE